jgi:TBC1 domain family member 10
MSDSTVQEGVRSEESEQVSCSDGGKGLVEEGGEKDPGNPTPCERAEEKDKDVEMYDRYGFLTVECPQNKAEQEEEALSKLKSPARTEKKERAAIAREVSRAEKWIRMMKDWDLNSPKFYLKVRQTSRRKTKRRGRNCTLSYHHAKHIHSVLFMHANLHPTTQLKRRSRKGIPDSVRGKAWGMMAGINERRKTDRKMYTRLLSREECPCESIIERDLARTFPRHEWFRKKSSGGQQALHNVLHAFSLYDVGVGYCQGMGFIAALLLSYMSEEDAFWMLVCLMEKYDMKRLFLPHFPLLQECFFVYEELIRKRLPKLHEHLEKEQVHSSMYVSQWFLTLFVYQFPFPVILRIWDIFVLEGWKVVFRVSLAVMRLLEKELLSRSFEHLMIYLKSETETLDEETVMKAVFQVRLTQKQVKELQDQHKAIVKEEQEMNGL